MKGAYLCMLFRMNLFRSITASLMALTLLVSTTGLSVHAVYCLCNGELSYSLVHLEVGEIACAMSSEEAEPCCGSREGCGLDSQASGCCQDAGDDHDCRSEETIYARLAAVFVTQSDQQDDSVSDRGDLVAGTWPASESHIDTFGLLPEWDAGPPSRGGPWPHCPAYLAFRQFRC